MRLIQDAKQKLPDKIFVITLGDVLAIFLQNTTYMEFMNTVYNALIANALTIEYFNTFILIAALHNNVSAAISHRLYLKYLLLVMSTFLFISIT